MYQESPGLPRMFLGAFVILAIRATPDPDSIREQTSGKALHTV
jgi:hypothetical protein